MNEYSIKIYMFGETHKITFKTTESLEELQENYKLLNTYVEEAIINELDIENDTLKQY